MGSFFATCSVTDMSITDGDGMYAMFIVPCNSPEWKKQLLNSNEIEIEEKGLRVSNKSPFAEWLPFGLPILSKYADYGDFDEYDPNSRAVKLLEDYFGLSIRDIMSAATGDRWYKLWYKPKFIDKVTEEYEGQWKPWQLNDGNDIKNVEILKHLNLTYINKETYDFLSEHEETGSFMYYVLEQEGHTLREAVTESFYNSMRVKLCKQLPHIFKSNLSNDEKESLLKDTITEIAKDDGLKTDMEIMVGKWADLLSMSYEELEKTELKFYHLFNPLSSETRRNYLPTNRYVWKNPFNELDYRNEDLDEILKLYKFCINMSNLYKEIRPSNYGSQSDNFKLWKKLHDHLSPVADELSKKWNEDE